MRLQDGHIHPTLGKFTCRCFRISLTSLSTSLVGFYFSILIKSFSKKVTPHRLIIILLITSSGLCFHTSHKIHRTIIRVPTKNNVFIPTSPSQLKVPVHRRSYPRIHHRTHRTFIIPILMRYTKPIAALLSSYAGRQNSDGHERGC